MGTLDDWLSYMYPSNASAPPPERGPGESAGGIGLDLVSNAIGGLGSAAKRAFQSSDAMQKGYGYDPAPMVNAAMLTMGGGAFGVPMRAGEAALGAGPIRTFGQRVQSIANKLEPELGDKVSIGTVYDNYGRDFPDAGSLASFKQRLVDAGKNRDVELHRSDMVDRFPGGKEERQRSEAKWGDDTVHFIRQTSNAHK